MCLAIPGQILGVVPEAPHLALVEVAGLVEDGAKVEIEATAALPPAGEES